MDAIVFDQPGGPGVLKLATRPVPEPAADEVLIAVAAAGVNRADIMQRKGQYPPPAGASDILGLEVAGRIVTVGAKVTAFKPGDRVCALLSGGGYAAYVAVPATHCLPLPGDVSPVMAAGLIEAAITVYANLFDPTAAGGGLMAGESVLLHGGTSGIGSLAIQLIRAAGASVIATVGSPEKMEVCYGLGADFVVNYKTEDFVEAALRATDRRGVSVVLDMVGGDYPNRNLQALMPRGRHVSIATQTGAKAEIDLRAVMAKQLVLTGSTLRARPKDEKARLVAAAQALFGSWITAGKVKPLIHRTFPFAGAASAHRTMEGGEHYGKIVLLVGATGEGLIWP